MTEAQLDFYKRLARALALQFGSGCEVVVHDLEATDPSHSIVAIENGHVTGRKLGDGPSHVVLEALHAGTEQLEDRLAYLTKTADGKILKSSTVFIRDDDGRTVGIFAVNYDITILRAMGDTIAEVVGTEPSAPREPEPIVRSVADLLDDLIEQSVQLVGTPVALMTKEEKVRAIRYLNDTGAFLITKSGPKVCKYFGISKYTLYNYLDEARATE
ncbi:MAG TPA: helix-turn-helix transcriptional regulator [Candidatus Olsenella excrementavium]|uniref:Helix-turn-helix transcriptional regulator n=1 Tax=Candidatus Olsenella excrementavium TaxID=2838709 RepID=A0A9D1ZBV8_9ACTN|nr:helix-turn-helix transcriptional regulator [Candidatus Olsenella excrementavium]